MSGTALREDVLVSICFSDLSPGPRAFETVRDVAATLDARFRFREIVLVVDAARHEAYLPLVESVPNVRLFAVRPGSGYYDRRVIAAEEAIGDIVLLANEDEIAHLDILAMIERAVDGNRAILAVLPAPERVRKGLWAPVIALGLAAGFKVNPRDLQTIALPRTQLNQILSHSAPELALRFPPRDPRLPLSFIVAEGDVPVSRDLSQMRRRLHLVQKLLVYIAPSLLVLVSLTAAFLTMLGMGYAVYVIGAWIVVEDLAPGWLTTSIMLSLTATFVGISILGLSLGMQHLLTQQRGETLDGVAHEVNRIDLFGAVASDLNVDLERDAGLPRGDRAKDRTG